MTSLLLVAGGRMGMGGALEQRIARIALGSSNFMLLSRLSAPSKQQTITFARAPFSSTSILPRHSSSSLNILTTRIISSTSSYSVYSSSLTQRRTFVAAVEDEFEAVEDEEDLFPEEDEEFSGTNTSFDDEDVEDLDPYVTGLRERLQLKKARANQRSSAVAVSAVSNKPLDLYRDLSIEESLFQYTVEDELARNPKPEIPVPPPTLEEYDFLPGIKIPVGGFYEIPRSSLKKVFPEGVAGGMLEEFLGLNRVGFFLRPVARDAIQKLKDLHQSGFQQQTTPLILDGVKGSGKSALLNQLVYWARSAGWLVVFLPRSAMVKRTGFLLPSRVHIGCFDQPNHARALCYCMLRAHGDKLKTLPLRRGPFTISTFSSEGKTLFDLLKFGCQKWTHSGDVVHYFMRELQRVTEFPVLVAYDAVDTTFSPSGFYDPHSTRYKPDLLPCEKLSMHREFMYLHSVPFLNGTVVYTREPTRKSKMPESLLEKARDTTIQVPGWTKSEFITQLEFYQHVGWLEKLPPLSVEYLYSMTNGLPSEAWKITKHTEMGDPARIAGLYAEHMTEEQMAQLEAKFKISEQSEFINALPEDIKNQILSTLHPDAFEESLYDPEADIDTSLPADTETEVEL